MKYVNLEHESTNTSENGKGMQKELSALVDDEFPSFDPPTAEDVEQAVLEDPGIEDLEYEAGQWVEFSGLDMKWHLAMVKRVIKQAPDEWDFDDPDNDGKEPEWEYSFNVGRDKMIPHAWVRAPEEGLKRIFGCGPFLWQQWALLRLEDRLRYQENHERDFEEIDCVKTADSMFNQWVDAEENARFKALYMSKGEAVRDKLVTHLLTPFYLMDQITGMFLPTFNGLIL